MAYITFFQLDGLELLPLHFSNITIFHTANSQSGSLNLAFADEEHRAVEELSTRLENGWKIKVVANDEAAYELEEQQTWATSDVNNSINLESNQINLIS